jgi:hypothetical protein
MVSDFFTKPLQGTTFHNVRDVIMNFDPVINSMQDYRVVLNEPEPEWTMVSYKRKEHRRSKEGDAAEINGSAVASTAHKNNLSRLSTLGVRCRCCFLIFSDTSYNRSRNNSCWSRGNYSNGTNSEINYKNGTNSEINYKNGTNLRWHATGTSFVIYLEIDTTVDR